MEKFGVEEKAQKTAESDETAVARQRCPWCKCLVEDISLTGGILICPEHGTEPFE